MDENKPIQFYVRKTNKDLIEIVEAYSINKIKIGFRNYNSNADKGSKISNSVDFYMSISEFELLCHNLLSGNIISRLNKGESIPVYYKGSTRDGSIYARTLSISKSNKGVFVTATEGPGEKTTTGAVKPLYKMSDAPQKVSISLDTEEIKNFALQGKRACDVFYIRMANNVQGNNV